MRLFIFILTTVLTAPAWAEPPKVVTDIAPVHGLVASVMEGVASPDVLLQPGADPHSYALRPSEAQALVDADLVFWVGPALTPWLSKSIDQLASQAAVTALLDQNHDALLEARGRDHDDEHDHDHGDHQIDPHAWLDPNIAGIWLDHIRDQLVNADPGNATAYETNAARAKDELAAVALKIKADLKAIETAGYFASHDSYQYFEHRFGLSLIASIALSDAAKPGPKTLRDVRQRATKSGASCLAMDATTSPDLIDTVTEGTQLNPTLIDPLGGGIPTGPAFYPTLITTIAGAFETCLKGEK